MNRKILLLKNLREDSYITASKLSEILNVSPRTVRNDITELNENMRNSGAQIFSKSRHGIRLVISDSEKYKHFLESFNKEFEEDSNARIYQVTEYLLELGEPITMDDLSEVFFISRSTLKSDMHNIRKILKKYDIELDARANQGLKIQGTEQNIRRCLTYIQRKNKTVYSSISKKDIDKIRKIIEICVNKYSFKISDYSITNLSLHIYISIMRIRSGKWIKISSNMKKHLDTSSDQILISSIVESIENTFNITFTKDEVYYLLIQLSGKRLIGNIKENKKNTIVTNEVYQLVGDMLSAVYETLRIDLRYDLELITALSMHLVPLEFRMKYDITVQNTMKEEIRQRVILPFNMASIACDFLEKKYNKRLPDDEVTFIALHFYVALERKRSGQKENLLVVCGSGKASSELLVYQIKKNLGDVFNVVDATSRHALKNYDFNKVDYILTTVDIDISVPVPIIMTEDFLEMSEVKRIQKKVSENHLKRVLHYFKKDMIFWLDLENKEDIIKFLCEKAIQQRSVPNNFYEFVLKREEIGRTSFGNLISIAHPIHPLGQESFVGIAILEKPIMWDDQKVQIVFLLSMKENGDRDLQDFYKIMGKLVTHRNFVNMLCKTRNYDEVVNILKEVASIE